MHTYIRLYRHVSSVVAVNVVFLLCCVFSSHHSLPMYYNNNSARFECLNCTTAFYSHSVANLALCICHKV